MDRSDRLKSLLRHFRIDLAAGGASSVTAVDSSMEALEAGSARHNFIYYIHI